VKDRVATVLKHDAMKTYGGDEVNIQGLVTGQFLARVDLFPGKARRAPEPVWTY